MLQLTPLTNVTDLLSLEPEWRTLWERSPPSTPFEGPDWLIPWVRYMWRGGRLLVITIRHGGELVGVAPFFLWGPDEENLSLLGAGITDYLGITVAAEWSEEAAAEVLAYLAETEIGWRTADFEELHADSPLLKCPMPHGIAARAMACSVCPVVSLPDSVEAFLAKLTRKFRANLRRRESRLREMEVETRPASPGETERFMRSLFELHTARWERKQGHGVLESDSLKDFHVEVSRRFARLGILRLYGLQRRGELIGVQYNFRGRRRVYFYLHGFDPGWSAYGPGSQLILASIEAAIKEGATEFDFLRNNESYKYDWGAQDRVNYRLILSRDLEIRSSAVETAWPRSRNLVNA